MIYSEPILSHTSSLAAGLQHHSSDKTWGIELNLGPSQGPQQHVARSPEGSTQWQQSLICPQIPNTWSDYLRSPDQIVWYKSTMFHISLSPRFSLSLHPSLSMSSPEKSPYSALSCMLSTFPWGAVHQLTSVQQKQIYLAQTCKDVFTLGYQRCGFFLNQWQLVEIKYPNVLLEAGRFIVPLSFSFSFCFTVVKCNLLSQKIVMCSFVVL